MSALRSFASLYCQKLRQYTRLGECSDHLRSAARLAVFEQRSFLTIHRHGEAKKDIETSSSATDTRPCRTLPPEQQPDHTPFFTWARLAIGSVLAIVTPFLHAKWATLLLIRREVEVVKDVVETVAEVVEKVATVTEKVSSEVAEQLPEDAHLKQAAAFVEHASNEVAEEAHLAQDIVHKVDGIEEDVKTILEPVTDHGNHTGGKTQSKSNH